MLPTLRNALVFAGLLAPVLARGDSFAEDRKNYDPLEVIETVAMEYPPSLEANHIDEGMVDVVVWVDDTGRMLDWMLLGYTHPLFAKEVLDVLPKWKFVAGRLQGRPVCTRTDMQFHFKNKGMIRILSADQGLRTHPRYGSSSLWSPQRIFNPEELDQPLDPVVEITPRPPDQLGAVAREGSVIVEYLIDADGRVRMPIIMSSDDEAFTNSVLLAITEWRYAVPKHKGLPVVARVRRKFTFSQAS